MLSVIRRATLRTSTPALSVVRGKAAYEGEGKTTVRVINQEYDAGLMIDSYATYGFKLNNGLTVLGPMAIFPRTVMSWQVSAAEEVTEQSLKLFKLLEPRIDLLVVGLDTNERPLQDAVLRLARSLGLNAEVLPTEHACSTFNFLNPTATRSHTRLDFISNLSDREVVGLDTNERPLQDAVLRLARSLGLNAEVLPTEHACSTFNFLNSEGRSVAAALIPPANIARISEDDMLHTKLHYHDVFNKPLL